MLKVILANSIFHTVQYIIISWRQNSLVAFKTDQPEF